MFFLDLPGTFPATIIKDASLKTFYKSYHFGTVRAVTMAKNMTKGTLQNLAP